MDLLTKYRPIRSLEFYQKKVIRFIHSSEGSDDLRSLGVPYGDLGFDSPLHFIKCIPQCEEFVCDKLFQRMDKTLRKGNRVFLSSDDGKIQSAIYKGQKPSNNGQIEVILDGHRNTYPVEDVIPYKAFLRKNVGAMLIDGPHKVIGPNVTYEEPKWEVGDAIYHKSSKRWGIIEDRDVVRGKVFCEIKLEKTKVKKEKILRMPLWELMADTVPYRIPIIPKNNAVKVPEEVIPTSNPKDDEINKTKHNMDHKLETSLPDRNNDNDSINRNKLSKQASKESESSKDISFRKSSSGESDAITIINNIDKETSSNPTRDTTAICTSDDTILIDLHNSPKLARPDNETSLELHHEVHIAPTVRRNPSRSMRPLTEYFHSQSVEVHDDYHTVSVSGPDLKAKSVNNLNTQVSEEEEFTFEKYSSSLRRSARNILAKQVAESVRKRDLERQRKNTTSLSTDNLHIFENNSSRSAPIIAHVSVSDNDSQLKARRAAEDHDSQPTSTTSMSTSANDTSGTESPPPPPLPLTLPPQDVATGRYETIHLKLPSSFDRSFSVVETVPRHYEHSNFRSATCSMSSEPSNNQHENRRTTPQKHNPPTKLTETENVDPKFKMARHHTGGSLSSYHEIEESQAEFPPYYFHHAISVPAFDIPQSSNTLSMNPQNYSKKPDNARQISTIEKQKYKKNPSTLRSKAKSVPNFVNTNSPAEAPLPQPFTIDNIQSAVGKGRGIQTGYHSSYADVSLFALFYCSSIFDKLLVENQGEVERTMKQDVKQILRDKIVKPLRLSAFCSWESVCHLRESMLPLSSKLNSSFMDSEEFLYLLFENALNIPEFIKYSNGTNDFMHQIIVKPKDRSRCQDVQFLLETSMEINNLKLKELPLPALMICMPRCNGRLVYYEAIVPNMRLNITPLVDKGPKTCLCEMAATFECAICYKTYGEMALAYCQTCQRMSEQVHYHMGHNPVLVPKLQKNISLSLLAVICIKNNHYSTFVKTGAEKYAPWLYYEATPNDLPQVQLLDDFGRWLDKLEREPARYRELAKTHLYLKRIITESHICIYFSPDAGKRSGNYGESFMV